MPVLCFFGCHDFARVEDVDHSTCGACFAPPERISEELKVKHPEYRAKGYCPHSFRVCRRCGTAVGFGSHGKLTVIPDGCKAQIEKMRRGQ